MGCGTGQHAEYKVDSGKSSGSTADDGHDGIWDTSFREVEIRGREGRYLNVWGNLFDLKWHSATHLKGRFRNVELKNKLGVFEWFFEDDSCGSFSGTWKWDDGGSQSQPWKGQRSQRCQRGAKPPTAKPTSIAKTSSEPSKPCKAALQEAIQRGVPLWNRQDYKGCSEMYKAVAEMYAADDKRLAKALREGMDAPVDSSSNSLGWILRRAFDAILSDAGGDKVIADDIGADDQMLVQASAAEIAAVQELFDKTLKSKRTRDRDGNVPSRLVVVQVQKNSNLGMLSSYLDAQEDIKGRRSLDELTAFLAKTHIEGNLLSDRLERHCGEAYLFHGTNPEATVSIAKHDFRLEVAGSNRGAMFGPGIYLAENSSKADEYAKDGSSALYKGIFAMLLCRTTLGKACVVKTPGDYKSKVTSGENDCVIGDREQAVGTYREVVLFSAKQVFPEYAVLYRRELSEDAS